MSDISPAQEQFGTQTPTHEAGAETAPKQEGKAAPDKYSQDEIDLQNMVADRLSEIIEHANEQLLPMCDMIRQHIENFLKQPEDQRDEDELIRQVKPLLEQSEKILHETHGAMHGADPDRKLQNQVKRNIQDHSASPHEQRLAVALQVLLEKVQGTINWAKDKIDSFPKAKRDLGPLLDALGQPITQIVAGVGMLLAGVLNLLGNLLSGLGLDSLLKGIIAATGLDKIYKGLGLQKWLEGGKKGK